MEKREVPQPQPWEGRALPFHPPTEIRREIRTSIIETIKGTAEHGHGWFASEVTEVVARQAYEQAEETGENSLYKTGDVGLELSRMMGTTIRMAPNKELHVDYDYIKRQKEHQA